MRRFGTAFGLLSALLLFAACSDGPVSPKVQPTTGALSATVPSGGVIYQDNSNDAKCVAGEWHWVITGLANAGLAPGSITVYFVAGGEVTVNLSKFTGGTAHYAYYGNLGDELASPAMAVLTPGTSYNRFNLSHRPCDDTTDDKAEGPTVEKDAAGAYNNTHDWSIDKTVDKTLVQQNGGTATFNYTVTVTHDKATIGAVKVTGTITVTNPNFGSVAITGITDELSDATLGNCTLDSSAPTTLPPGVTPLGYTCNLSGLPTSSLTNAVTVSWGEQDVDIGGGVLATLAEGSANFGVDVSFTGNEVDECVAVSDTYAGSLGNVCVADSPKAFTYARTVNVPAETCVKYDNTASFTTNDTGAKEEDSQSVNVCGRVTSGLTMGFWGNKNGQDLIANTTYSGTACANLKTYLTGFNPFKDYTGTTCNNLKTYTTNVFSAANASGAAMNAMLKGQMLATALSAFFSNLNAIPGGALGPRKVDLTLIAKPVNSTTYKNTSSAFDGSNVGTCQTVNTLLTYASSQSNSGGSSWYGQVKATQENAKDTFDAINNKVVFACP